MRRDLLVGIVVVATTVTATPALAAGYWNLPSTFCQCMGYGCGAGYHAPLVLGPASCDGWVTRNEIRLLHARRPMCASGRFNGDESFHALSALEPIALPGAEALPAPIPALHRPPLRR